MTLILYTKNGPLPEKENNTLGKNKKYLVINGLKLKLYLLQKLLSYVYINFKFLGINCNVTWNVPFGRTYLINFNGSAPNSCNELKFRSTGQHKLCIKSQLFQDPDCAVNLRLNDTKSGQVNHHRLKE